MNEEQTQTKCISPAWIVDVPLGERRKWNNNYK